MELVPKTKYTPFRSDSFSSTDETVSNPSLPSSAPLTPLTPPGIPPSLSSSSLTPILPPSSPWQAENSPTTLCSFFPRMGALRLGVSSTLLPGLKASSRPANMAGGQGGLGESAEDTGTSAANSSPPPPLPLLSLTAPSPPPRPPQDMNRLGGASRRARVEGGQLGGDEWTRQGSFVNKPTRGWLHSDNVVSTTGVSYTVRVRCIRLSIQAENNYNTTKTQAISVVCEAVPGAKGAQRRRKPSSRCLSSILGKSNLQFAGMTISLTVSTSSLNLLAIDCKQIIANHHMQSISFASGGDPVSRVLSLNMSFYFFLFLLGMLIIIVNFPYGQPSQNDIHKQPLPPLPGQFSYRCSYRIIVNCPKIHQYCALYVLEPFDAALGVSGAVAPPLAEQLQNEPWFHGPLSRRQAERLLTKDGDFLVRESSTTPGQYVLTGQQGGQPKHLLLVDPEGVVRTKDHRFESVSHLISYHMDNRLPIISAGSEVCLQQPVDRRA
uniref:SHC-transforming protein 1 n=1 Tax=Cyprinus carpio TaxID=7962 RepID=A0A8C1NYF4_CYPCA